MDLSQREGRYPVPPQARKILGVEFSGVIVEMNENDVAGFKEGDVFGLAYGGVLENLDITE
jgi:NADPH:quinone reductase-like Zn-dependent oxidoreductase